MFFRNANVLFMEGTGPGRWIATPHVALLGGIRQLESLTTYETLVTMKTPGSTGNKEPQQPANMTDISHAIDLGQQYRPKETLTIVHLSNLQSISKQT
jgi:hypothetical protein